MAKRKKLGPAIEDVETKKPKAPVLTHAAYQITLWAIALGLAAQIVMAILAYPILPSQIPSGWAGSAAPYNTIPSYVVFLLFPGGQIVLALIALFSPKNDAGKRVMETGKAVSLILLALLFTALQASAFHLPRMGKM